MTSLSNFRPSRRDVLALGAGIFVIAALPFAVRARNAQRRSRARLVRRSMPLMGTIAELAVVSSGDPAAAQAGLDAAFDELLRVERTMTRYSDLSDVGRANLAAAGEPTVVTAETANVVEHALAWASMSDGAFDPCLGGASSLWDVERRDEPPAEPLLRRFAGRHLYRQLDVDRFRGAPVVLLRDADVRLDLGGIAKGYHGIRDALVNVGGDLVALGVSEDGDPWKVGVRSPSDPTAITCEIDVRDEAVATSGDYERYFTWHGRRYHHLLDPATAAPRVTSEHSVTIIAPTCLAADAAATACFGMDPRAADALLARRAPGARLGAAL